MIEFETRRVISVHEFLKHLGMDENKIERVMYDIHSSDISFGTNPDTLLDVNKMEEFISPHGALMPKEFDAEDIWFSLGC